MTQMTSATPERLQPQPGTIGLVHTGGLAGWIIREDTQDRWNHVVLAGLDCIYEADPKHGYIRSSPHSYAGEIVWLTREVLTDGQRMRRVDAAIERLGLPYNWPAIAAIALHNFRGFSLNWLNSWATNRKHLMCSEAVAEIARESGTAWFGPDILTSTITPGDIDFDFRLRGI